MPILLIVIVVLFTGVWYANRTLQRRRRFRHLLTQPLTEAQRDIVAREVPLIHSLPQDLQIRLDGKMNAFLDQITFIGCDDLEVTEDMELSIAAQASLLIVNTDQWYRYLRTVLIYPGAFKSVNKNYDGYVVTEEETVRLGESWSKGPVILSWADSQQGALNTEDGRNVVLHEFAHQLDDLSGQTDGIPVLRRGHRFADWKRVIVTAFYRHERRLEKGRKTVLDAYGAEGPEEFFAVAIEAFFEKPSALRDDEPELYEQLSMLLKLDPVRWSKNV